MGAVAAGMSAFWLGCGALGAAKTELGTGNWLAAAFEDPEIVLALFTENGEKGCPKPDAGSLALTAVSGALSAWNGDGAAGVTVFPRPTAGKDDGAFGSANGLFDATVVCWALESLLDTVD